MGRGGESSSCSSVVRLSASAAFARTSRRRRRYTCQWSCSASCPGRAGTAAACGDGTGAASIVLERAEEGKGRLSAKPCLPGSQKGPVQGPRSPPLRMGGGDPKVFRLTVFESRGVSSTELAESFPTVCLAPPNSQRRSVPSVQWGLLPTPTLARASTVIIGAEHKQEPLGSVLLREPYATHAEQPIELD